MRLIYTGVGFSLYNGSETGGSFVDVLSFCVMIFSYDISVKLTSLMLQNPEYFVLRQVYLVSKLQLAKHGYYTYLKIVDDLYSAGLDSN